MIPVSSGEIQSGRIRTWYSTISTNLSTTVSPTVCCVAVVRSETPHAQLLRNTDSCDTLHVPMVRPDEYLSVSEKVKLGITLAHSYYDFDWLLKTDSDSFVCFTRVLRLLSNFDAAGIVYVGYAESTNFLKPDPSHQWYDPSLTDILHNPQQHIEKQTVMHHPYMQGAGYILSRGAFNAVNKVNKLLRYSPIEDAMVGGWLLTFTTHRAFMGLDLWAFRRHCHLQPFDYISHNRKGKNVLQKCIKTNYDCLEVSERDDVDVRKVAFLLVSDVSNKTRQFIDVYESIRAAFPHNEVVLGDTSSSYSAMKRFLSQRSDDNVKVLWSKEKPRSMVLNELVSSTVSPFVCILSVEQKISWETMIGRMLRPVWKDEADITSGFLVFNHNRAHSEQGLFPNGHTIRQNNSEIAFEQVETSWNIGVEHQRTVHATSGFLLARTSFLKKTGWRDYGPFSEAEFSLRLWRGNARVKLVNSGIRHGYHYAVDPPSESAEDVKFGESDCFKRSGALFRTVVRKEVLKISVEMAEFVREMVTFLRVTLVVRQYAEIQIFASVPHQAPLSFVKSTSAELHVKLDGLPRLLDAINRKDINLGMEVARDTVKWEVMLSTLCRGRFSSQGKSTQTGSQERRTHVGEKGDSERCPSLAR
ncbi:Galactosyltransferase 31 [Gracilaria domingensis]|nr:Galactosyltransferase 31 [Gracilaria domingensis]